MQRIGHNQFIWGVVPDILKTNNTDILMRTGPPIPVSSRCSGYSKDIVRKLDEMLRVKWFFLFEKEFLFFLYISVPVLYFFTFTSLLAMSKLLKSSFKFLRSFSNNKTTLNSVWPKNDNKC
jgi:hypothetical protein